MSFDYPVLLRCARHDELLHDAVGVAYLSERRSVEIDPVISPQAMHSGALFDGRETSKA